MWGKGVRAPSLTFLNGDCFNTVGHTTFFWLPRVGKGEKERKEGRNKERKEEGIF